MRIHGDWGTSRLRLWRLQNGKPVGRIEGPGIGGLSQPPANVLRDLLAPWLERELPERVVLCGMAGARNGLHESAYVECPASAQDWAQGAALTALDGLPIRIAAGIACAGDVMRGEETQVFGALARRVELGQGRRDFLLPGTHSKWVRLEHGRIVGLRTFLTGELYALLGSSSLMAAGGADNSDDEAVGFAEGLAEGRERPGLLGSLFHTRLGQLRRGRSRGWARGLLSGLLLGNECAEMAQGEGLPSSVVMIGDDRLSARYEMALAAFGVVNEQLDADACALAGLELVDADD